METAKASTAGSALIKVGICAMDAKAKSKAMRAILQRLEKTQKFTIIIWGNKMLLENPVSEWPLVDCLIAFYSGGFPLEKASQYTELNRHRMFVVNDLASQRLLLDRRLVSAILNLHSIPTPRTLIVSKDGLPSSPINPLLPGSSPQLQELPDSIIVNGSEMTKPFVEKPTNGENHNIHIYYHSNDGGGSRRLFRKVNNQSSEGHPQVSQIRNRERESYIYEEFVTTYLAIPSRATTGKPVQKDLKIYTVGESYAHAEARKSPEVDGKVERLPDGREVRHIIRLTEQEQAIASSIVRCFKQRVCGFDVLRASKGNSFVCDVNGWSFVKGNDQYYDKCGEILTEMFVAESQKIKEKFPPESSPLPDNWKLRGLVSVFRHADRTPKQKVKIKITNPKILALFVRSDKEVKMKSDKNQKELSNLLNIIVDILNAPQDPQGNPPGVEGHDSRTRLQLVCAVVMNLYQGLKIQIKPHSVDNSVQPAVIKRALMVCKWGGMLTQQGEQQAWRLGKLYRNLIKNDVNRHSLEFYLDPAPKISSNNERRVKRTAELVGAGFMGRGMDDPPPVADNTQTNHILGDINNAKDTIDEMKQQLHDIIHSARMSDVKNVLINCGVPPLEEMARSNQEKNPLFFLLNDLLNYLKCVCQRLENLSKAQSGPEPTGEPLSLMLQRWKRLTEYIFSHKTKQFDVTKVPDVEDYVKYDIIHNRAVLGDQLLTPLFSRAKVLADFIVPGEYGIRPVDKLKIGYQTCRPLCESIIQNIAGMMNGDDAASIYLHFTSESHVHPLLNLLLHTSVVPMQTLDFFTELNYLTQVIFKVYEDTSKPSDDPDRFIIQLYYSFGAIGDALACTPADNRILPVVPAICINKGVTFQQLKEIFFDSVCDL